MPEVEQFLSFENDVVGMLSSDEFSRFLRYNYFGSEWQSLRNHLLNEPEKFHIICNERNEIKTIGKNSIPRKGEIILASNNYDMPAGSRSGYGIKELNSWDSTAVIDFAEEARLKDRTGEVEVKISRYVIARHSY